MMSAPALQLSTSDSMFVVMVIVAAAFIVIAAAMVAIAVAVFRVVRTVNNLERRAEPLIERVGALSAQVQQIAEQGREVGEQVSVMSGHLSVASEHFAATTAVVRVSLSVEQANQQFSHTVGFINAKLVRPARELAALMAGVRRGLEVLAAPAPKQIDQTYGEEE